MTMKRIPTLIMAVAFSAIFSSCNSNNSKFDASGIFEAEEVIISAEGTGSLKQFNLEEGQALQSGELIGYIDTVQLSLRRKQLEAQINAMQSKKPSVNTQLAALQEQLKTAEKEQKRISNLAKADAATLKQLDDINGQVEVIKKQLDAQKSTLEIATDGIDKDVLPMKAQIDQLNDLIEKCKVVNPIKGTVLTKYAEANEMAVQGKPLYKIADLTKIVLRVYITGNQLALIRLNQKVKVLTDDGKGEYNEAEGVVSWINDKAEFTPKTIQTKDERANTVYACKVKVANRGMYKIGMYGEIKFQ